ncbi:MAG TPA: efflux RND transporter periplasmic adaptor subunit, partial [Blastocatellia bacterium]|nr:efflux RND transporter periplasmic adaptor subunit [Blastocatellia bacterium]
MRTNVEPSGACCFYPPRVADQVDVTEQIENDSIRYVVRNRATSRYFLLKQPEYQIFKRIDGSNTAAAIASPSDGADPRASLRAVIKFLSRLDSLGLLAREGEVQFEQPSAGLYRKLKLFNPDELLSWVDQKLGWALTRRYITGSFLMMALVTVGILFRAGEMASYTTYTYSRYGLTTIVIFTLAIATLHEMAHGLACKHFGGHVPEAGVLMIFYVLPAFYCNVTDIYRFGRKSERLWVISAGIYWQLIVSSAGALVWLVATPRTLLADFAFLLLLGGTFNLLINCNPLIKLDGYYALSQICGVHNLQSRSSEYVRTALNRLIDGTPPAESREKQRGVLYASYWGLSIVYSVVLVWLILATAGRVLMDRLGFLGVLLTLALAATFGQRFLRPVIQRMATTGARIGRILAHHVPAVFKRIGVGRFEHLASAAPPEARREGGSSMSSNSSSQQPVPGKVRADGSPKVNNRRRWVKVGVAILVLAFLIAPWESSAGSDCTLTLPPGRESSVHANVDAVLAEVYVLPGDTVAAGTKIARLANPDLEDRLTDLSSQVTRLDTRNGQIEEELRVRSEELLSANFKKQQTQRLTDELKNEAAEIAKARGAKEVQGSGAAGQPGSAPLPPSLAVLESDIELRQVELDHNRQEVKRYKELYDQGLVGTILYDAAVNAARVTEKELQAAKNRLDAAMVDHHRLVDSTQTGSLVAETEAQAARSNFQALISELHSNREQIEALRARRDILQREYDGMNIVAPRPGIVLGEDLRRSIGSHYARGQEICRIGELEKFLLRIDVSERDISDVRLESPVRFKLKTVPGRTFTAYVSKIKAESTTNES